MPIVLDPTTVRLRRVTLELTQMDLAVAAGISLTTMTRIEGGVNPRRQNRVAEALAGALGVTVESITKHDETDYNLPQIAAPETAETTEAAPTIPDVGGAASDKGDDIPWPRQAGRTTSSTTPRQTSSHSTRSRRNSKRSARRSGRS